MIEERASSAHSGAGALPATIRANTTAQEVVTARRRRLQEQVLTIGSPIRLLLAARYRASAQASL